MTDEKNHSVGAPLFEATFAKSGDVVEVIGVARQAENGASPGPLPFEVTLTRAADLLEGCAMHESDPTESANFQRLADEVRNVARHGATLAGRGLAKIAPSEPGAMCECVMAQKSSNLQPVGAHDGWVFVTNATASNGGFKLDVFARRDCKTCQGKGRVTSRPCGGRSQP